MDDDHVPGAALKQVPVVLLGFGKVGQAFASLLSEREGFARQGAKLRLVGVFDRSGGAIGADLPAADLLEAKRTSGAVASVPRWGHSRVSPSDALSRYPGAVLVDVSPTDPDSGEPGLSVVRDALERGHSSVLASKGPLVVAFAELLELARRRSCRIGISAAVGTPLPSLEMLHLGLRGTTLVGFRGVFNTTANRILTQMESGASYHEALKDAERAGILETDPRQDIEGWDTAFKVLILARSIWRPTIPMESAEVRGIEGITGADIARLKESGRRPRLVGTARWSPSGDVAIRVGVESLPPSDPLHWLGPGEKGAQFDTDLLGRFVLRTSGAGPATTAVSIVKDILNIAAHPIVLAL